MLTTVTATYEAGTATSNATTPHNNNALTVTNTSATLGSAITNTTATVGYNVAYSFILTNVGNNDLYVKRDVFALWLPQRQPVLQDQARSLQFRQFLQLQWQEMFPQQQVHQQATLSLLVQSRAFTLAGAIRGTSGQTGVNLKVTTIYYGTTPATAQSQACKHQLWSRQPCPIGKLLI